MVGAEDETDEDEETSETDEAEITLQALTGWDTPQTLRTSVKTSGQNLVALIDSGSTHNFISEKVANRLNLQVSPTKEFKVQVADGHPLRCDGVYRAVTTVIESLTFAVDLYVLPLTGLDVVLGIQWLSQLGPTLCDWKERTMKFMWANKMVRIQGLANRKITQAQSKEVAREAQKGQACFALSIQQTPTNNIPIPESMSMLLQQYARIFDTPTTLPPERDIEHHITLKEGSDPVNVRPYRYAHFQKEEIEKQVNETLKTGLIRNSSSPFSSPVLLVKKKDGSWQFCTDYRALKASTIKDRFPIPTVEDMLDELHGASIFTKLDLTARYHQVRVHPSDVPKTASRTHSGHYEYLVMPFGLCNAPSTFQALMNSVFCEHLCKFVLVFFDDILVYSRT